jgi:hypothetical protein
MAAARALQSFNASRPDGEKPPTNASAVANYINASLLVLLPEPIGVIGMLSNLSVRA